MSDSCLAMNRPDYFWPVHESTKDTELYSVTDVSSKFEWIFLLGFLTLIMELAALQFERLKEEDQKK